MKVFNTNLLHKNNEFQGGFIRVLKSRGPEEKTVGRREYWNNDGYGNIRIL